MRVLYLLSMRFDHERARKLSRDWRWLHSTPVSEIGRVRGDIEARHLGRDVLGRTPTVQCDMQFRLSF